MIETPMRRGCSTGTVRRTDRFCEEQHIPLPLMVAPAVEVRNVLVQRLPE